MKTAGIVSDAAIVPNRVAGYRISKDQMGVAHIQSNRGRMCPPLTQRSSSLGERRTSARTSKA